MAPDGRQSTPPRGHGNIFTPHAGSMLIHVHREGGLAHRTVRLKPWQMHALRLITSRWFLLMFVVGVLSWGWFAVQAARVPLLQQRVTHMEQDEVRLDTLQATLLRLQARYDQVQRMLSATSAGGSAVQRVPAAVKRASADSARKPE